MRFEEHDGLLFRMLDEPVPLKESDANVLVRFITHGVIGKYVKEHWLDCNQKNEPIYIDDVDSDGDVTVWIDEDRNSHHCCPFPVFEVIGTLVKEGSADWALYQMMQGNKVRNRDWDGELHEKSLLYCQLIGETIKHNEGCSALDVCLSDWEAPYIKNTGWQIYKEPKEEPPKEPDYVICKKCGGTGYEIKEPCDAPNPESATQTPLPVSDATQWKAGDWVEVEETTTGEIEHHIVERINTFCPVSPEYLVDDMWFNHDGMEIIPLDWTGCRKRITRKLDPSEVVIHIGCLSGTIAKSSDPNYFLMLHSRPITDCNHSMIRFSAIDTETREFVEGLLEAQEEE